MAIEVRKLLISDMFEEIGMKVTKYMSNSSIVLNSIAKDDLGRLMKKDEPDNERKKNSERKGVEETEEERERQKERED